MLKGLSNMILHEGGVVRRFINLGDRVLVKNYNSLDGMNYGVGRFLQVSF